MGNKAIDEWCVLAQTFPPEADLTLSENHPEVVKFAKMLCRFRYGIFNHCNSPIHTGTLEVINNKIKVIKRKAYGYHGSRSFSLKIIQSFTH
jgi:transposase